MKWEPKECKAGDIVRIKLGGVYHFGIFVSEDEVIQFGLPPTAENRAKEGEPVVCATDIDVFSCAQIVETAVPDRSERKRLHSPAEIVASARARLGEGGYNLIHNNCEHFVYECAFGEKRCTQEEEVRRRWASRPVCDVYLALTPGEMPNGEIYPEKRKAELAGISNEKQRREQTACWLLLEAAAKRSFGTDMQSAGFRKKLGGAWVCEKFQFALKAYSGVCAAVVSNGKVSLELGEKPGKGAVRTLKDPRAVISVNGEKAQNVNFFLVENGVSKIMDNSYFA